MQLNSITLISTAHREIGKCSAEELHKLINYLNPDVIFLEALKESYSKYDQMVFSQFGVYNDRLELKAMQIFSQIHAFEYVPVLDIGLSDDFERMTRIVSENTDYQKLLDNYILLKEEGGFEFLNSKKSIQLQEEMRELGNRIIDDETFNQNVNSSIDAYENSMLHNIYSFCKEKSFTSAIFMCGAAHRKSIIEKIKNSELNWALYNDTF